MIETVLDEEERGTRKEGRGERRDKEERGGRRDAEERGTRRVEKMKKL